MCAPTIFLVVLVTGATGYIASHIIKILLEEGRYQVRATARSIDNNKRLEALKSALKTYDDQPEYVAADLTDPQTWTRSVFKSAISVIILTIF